MEIIMPKQSVTTLKPEERARVWIDRKLEQSGWKIVNRDEYHDGLTAVAIREGLLERQKEVDYLLMLNGKACAILEAKRPEIPLDNEKLIKQAENYTQIIPSTIRAHERPLKLVLLSNGKKIAFKNGHKFDSRYELVEDFPRPKDVARILKLENPYSGLPTLSRMGLRDCQYEAIVAFENSLRSGKKRALMVLATGAGKTYTACLAAYRMLNYCRAKRVLFLVDRTNLGVQAETEFSKFRRTENGNRFSDSYVVERITSPKISTSSEVVICTIQRLFSVLTGYEDESLNEDENKESTSQVGHEVKVPENPKLPRDFFDLIIVDECHRSIYGDWKNVLTYFENAVILGLTATPIKETEEFFDNKIIDYSLEQSIVDGVNVDCRVYCVKSHMSQFGATVNPGERIKTVARINQNTETKKTKDQIYFSKGDLGRSVIAPDQYRKILSRYKEDVYTKLYPERKDNQRFESLPKTLIFAPSEAHAREVVKIAQEVFGHKDDHFVQQITYSVGDSEKLIRSFRNDKDFRIAVTVTLVATGTDIKPLEVLIFLKDVQSEALYKQMKGRGVRTISDEKLREVTPNATSKEFFYLIDAVGVTESEKKQPAPNNVSVFHISFKELFEKLAHGNVQDEYLQLLAQKLSSLLNRAEPEKIAELEKIIPFDLREFVLSIFEALENDSLPPFESIDSDNEQRMALIRPLMSNVPARKKIIEIAAGYIKTLVDTLDELEEVGFGEETIERAKKAIKKFEDFIEKNRDSQEALRIILDNEGEPITKELLEGLDSAIKTEIPGFSTAIWWRYYGLLNPDRVTMLKNNDEAYALTNLIQLVRFGYRSIEKLCSVPSLCAQLFALWCGQIQRVLTDKQKILFSKVARYVAQNGAITTVNVFKNNDPELRRALTKEMGSLVAANDAVIGLSAFLLNRKVA